VSWWTRYPERRQVYVTTKTDKTFAGLLWRKGRDYLVLKQATLMARDGTRTSMDGEVVIERVNVDVMQVLG